MWSAAGDEKRSAKAQRALEKHGRALSEIAVVEARGPVHKLARSAAGLAPLLALVAVFVLTLVESWPLQAKTPWILLGALLLTAAMVFTTRRWRPQAVFFLAAIPFVASVFASFLLYPTVMGGGAVAPGLESFELGHLVCVALLTLPVFYAWRWWSHLWVPFAIMAAWSALPFVAGFFEEIPLEELPLWDSFWSQWPLWLQPLFGMVFVYLPLSLAMVVLTTLGQLVLASEWRQPGAAAPSEGP